MADSAASDDAPHHRPKQSSDLHLSVIDIASRPSDSYAKRSSVARPFGLEYDPFDPASIPIRRGPCCCCAIGGFRVIHRATIDARPEVVWAAITNFSAFPDWNPFHRTVETTLEPGSEFKMRVDMELQGRPKNTCRSVTEYVEFVDQKNFILTYGRRGMLPSERIQAVRATANGQTEYVSADVIGGCLGWLIKLTFASKVERGFNAQVLALKAYVETGKTITTEF